MSIGEGVEREDLGASSSTEPASGLGPSGFDPSRDHYRSRGYAMAYVDSHERDSDGAPLREVWQFATEDSGSDGDGWLEIRVHEIVETKRSGTLAIYYRQWFAPDGEPAWSKRPKRVAGSLASLKALIRRHKMRPCGAQGEQP